jgi:alkaline phosphatase D
MVNQVMVAPFKVFNAAFNSDQWDGYPSERKKLFKIINDYSIKNFVVLTGDIHSAWANDLPFGIVGYNAGTHKGSVGVEFVTTAVTSPGIPLTGILGNITQNAFAQLIRDNNAHVKHNNMVKRGFNIIDFTKEKCQSDFYNIETIETPNKNYTYQVSYLTEKDSNYLKMSTTQTTTTQINPIKAPLQVRQNIISSVKNKTNNIEITGVYPNPFINYTGIQYAVSTSSTLYVYVYNNAGQLVFYKDLGIKNKGVYFEKFDLGDLPNGNYILNLFNGIDLISRKISKSE